MSFKKLLTNMLSNWTASHTVRWYCKQSKIEMNILLPKLNFFSSTISLYLKICLWRSLNLSDDTQITVWTLWLEKVGIAVYFYVWFTHFLKLTFLKIDSLVLQKNLFFASCQTLVVKHRFIYLYFEIKWCKDDGNCWFYVNPPSSPSPYES